MSEEKKKPKITPEQVEKACDAMGKAASSVDNFYDNVKFKLGPMGAALGFGVFMTLVIALIASPGLMIVLALMVTAGASPLIRKKLLEVKDQADKLKKEKEAPESKVEQKEEQK